MDLGWFTKGEPVETRFTMDRRCHGSYRVAYDTSREEVVVKWGKAIASYKLANGRATCTRSTQLDGSVDSIIVNPEMGCVLDCDRLMFRMAELREGTNMLQLLATYLHATYSEYEPTEPLIISCAAPYRLEEIRLLVCRLNGHHYLIRMNWAGRPLASYPISLPYGEAAHTNADPHAVPEGRTYGDHYTAKFLGCMTVDERTTHTLICTTQALIIAHHEGQHLYTIDLKDGSRGTPPPLFSDSIAEVLHKPGIPAYWIKHAEIDSHGRLLMLLHTADSRHCILRMCYADTGAYIPLANERWQRSYLDKYNWQQAPSSFCINSHGHLILVARDDIVVLTPP
jgi:hypothetical protein